MQTFSGQGITNGIFNRKDFSGNGQTSSATTNNNAFSGSVYIISSTNVAFTADVLNIILQNIYKYNSDNPSQPPITVMTGSG
jgi:hypothetical protein